MKKIFCLACVLFASVDVFAQEKIIQRAEFETINKSSSQLLSGKTRRIIRTVQSTVEIMPPTNASNELNKAFSPPQLNIGMEKTEDCLKEKEKENFATAE